MSTKSATNSKSLKVEINRTPLDFFKNFQQNENMLYNKNELLHMISLFFNDMDYKSIHPKPENLYEMVNFIKICVKKDKNIYLDPMFALSYVLIYLLKIKTKEKLNKLNNLTSKILFTYANLYSQINENGKSCFAIVKHFEIDNHIPNNIIESKNWLVQEYNNLNSTLSNIKSELIKQIKFILQSITVSISSIIENEFNMNFLILLINNFVGIEVKDENNFKYRSDITMDLINSAYDFLITNKFILFSNLSEIHFNNLTKVLCRMNEYLSKIDQILMSNNIKLFLYELLFSSKFANLESTISLLINHINDFIIAQNSKNWKNLLEDDSQYLEKSNTNLFMDFIINKLDTLTKDNSNSNNKFISIINIIGKIYSFYFYFNNLNNQTINQKVSYLSNKILNFSKCSKLITEEVLIIKVNIFKDYINENISHIINTKEVCNNNMNSKTYRALINALETIESHIIEFKYIIESISNNSINLISILKFLKNIFNNLIVVIITLYPNYEFIDLHFVRILRAIQNLFEYIIKYCRMDSSAIADEFNSFYYYSKIFINDPTSSSNLKLNLMNEDKTTKISNSLVENFSKFISYANNKKKLCSTPSYANNFDDIKNKLNSIISYYIYTFSIDKSVYIINLSSKFDYNLFTNNIISFLNCLDKNNCEFILKYGDYIKILEKIVELIYFFVKESDLIYIQLNLQDKEKFLYKLERLLIYIFNEIIQNILLNIKNKNIDMISINMNLFFKYYKATFDVIEKLKIIFNYNEYHTGLIIVLDLLEHLFNLNDTSFVSSFINKLIFTQTSANHFKEVITREDYYYIFESFCLDFIINKEKIISPMKICYEITNKQITLHESTSNRKKFDLNECAINMIEALSFNVTNNLYKDYLMNNLDFKNKKVKQICNKIEEASYSAYKYLIETGTEAGLTKHTDTGTGADTGTGEVKDTPIDPDTGVEMSLGVGEGAETSTGLGTGTVTATLKGIVFESDSLKRGQSYINKTNQNYSNYLITSSRIKDTINKSNFNESDYPNVISY